MQEHPLVGDRDAEVVAHFGGIQSQHVAHGDHESLPLGQLVELSLGKADEFIT